MGTGLIASLALAMVPLAADRYRDHLAAEAERRFGALTFADYQRLQRDPLVNEKLFRVGGVFADGVRLDRREARVRYPATFLGIVQCVVVVWSHSGVRVLKLGGGVCAALEP
jgi:hypothetical protein